ncbi:MAG: hypothetical protein R3D44_02930 [Hyphomicrobiaceae bacterium]
MMEIVYVPVVLSCALQSLAFGALFAATFPFLERRFGRLEGTPSSGFVRRLGLALTSGAVFGLTHLAIVCAEDGFPPRIIQSTAASLAVVALAGAGLIRAGSTQRALPGR